MDGGAGPKFFLSQSGLNWSKLVKTGLNWSNRVKTSLNWYKGILKLVLTLVQKLVQTGPNHKKVM